jgi:hypothetical protein
MEVNVEPVDAAIPCDARSSVGQQLPTIGASAASSM